MVFPHRTVFSPIELLWAFIGLILTIGGTFLEAFIAGLPLNPSDPSIPIQSLGVTWQIGAVLLVGCLGGKNAAAVSQVAYLLLGLTWFNIFTDGGGIQYIFEPTFGYLVGFIPGAWVCGWLAFRVRRRLESLAFSCLCGLVTIHLVGIASLVIVQTLNWNEPNWTNLWSAIATYSIVPIPGQLALVCAVTVVSYSLRHVLFY
ncbi:MAG: biotin transporter BioY [Synechococcales bacterium]|nr:biotin transporter BioY [Synechococcales bacterium]